jgi:formylglycine-generating enzyme required for sulfatase activity
LVLRRWAWPVLLLLAAGFLALGAGRAWVRHRLETAAYAPPPPGMVLVPAGWFLMGSDDPEAEPDERPRRRVWLPAFYVDRLEVTNRELARALPQHTYPEGEGDLPATHVLKAEAEAYARAVGKRLPTAAEWEKAARGTDGRRYPWGDDWRPECANVQRRDLPSPSAGGEACELRPGRKLPGGRFPCDESPYGAQDLAGNVWEWVADVYRDRGWLGLPVGETRGILKGGAYGYGPRQCQASYHAFEGLESTCNDTGFRCAQEARPEGG